MDEIRHEYLENRKETGYTNAILTINSREISEKGGLLRSENENRISSRYFLDRVTEKGTKEGNWGKMRKNARMGRECPNKTPLQHPLSFPDFRTGKIPHSTCSHMKLSHITKEKHWEGEERKFRGKIPQRKRRGE